MKTRYLNYFILTFDAFGKIPLWSLQHPKKEAKDSFLIPVWNKTIRKTKWFKLIQRLKRAEDLGLSFSIHGKVTYRPDKKGNFRYIEGLRIDHIHAYDEYEYEPEK